MSRFSGKRPSAGVIIGMLALVMAMTGTAIAGSATSARITKRTIRTIAANEVHKLAPNLSVKSAETANTANSAKIATNVLSAMVFADGTMLGSIPRGATSTSVAVDGVYNVTLGRDITGCTISASIADNTSNPPVGMVAVGILNSTTLRVSTLNSQGTGQPEPFYVQAICPGG